MTDNEKLAVNMLRNYDPTGQSRSIQKIINVLNPGARMTRHKEAPETLLQYKNKSYFRIDNKSFAVYRDEDDMGPGYFFDYDMNEELGIKYHEMVARERQCY